MSNLIKLAKMLENVSKAQVKIIETLGKIVISNAEDIKMLAKHVIVLQEKVRVLEDG